MPRIYRDEFIGYVCNGNVDGAKETLRYSGEHDKQSLFQIACARGRAKMAVWLKEQWPDVRGSSDTLASILSQGHLGVANWYRNEFGISRLSKDDLFKIFQAEKNRGRLYLIQGKPPQFSDVFYKCLQWLKDCKYKMTDVVDLEISLRNRFDVLPPIDEEGEEILDDPVFLFHDTHVKMIRNALMNAIK